MNVSELIEQLNKLSPDLLICISNEGFDDEFSSMLAEHVTTKTIVIYDDGESQCDENGDDVGKENDVVMISCC